jgi:hypothetical protein
VVLKHTKTLTQKSSLSKLSFFKLSFLATHKQGGQVLGLPFKKTPFQLSFKLSFLAMVNGKRGDSLNFRGEGLIYIYI